MHISEWIDTPVPTVVVDETHDAIGKLATATREVESLLAFAAFRLGARPSYEEAARLRASRLVVKVRQSADHLPEPEREELTTVLRRCSAVLEFRNAVVHALPRRYTDGHAQEAWGLQAPTLEAFPRELLHGAAVAADAASDYFRSRIHLWPLAPTRAKVRPWQAVSRASRRRLRLRATHRPSQLAIGERLPPPVANKQPDEARTRHPRDPRPASHAKPRLASRCR